MLTPGVNYGWPPLWGCLVACEVPCSVSDMLMTESVRIDHPFPDSVPHEHNRTCDGHRLRAQSGVFVQISFFVSLLQRWTLWILTLRGVP